MTFPQPYTHPTPLKTLAPCLVPQLPHSLPLLRRLQFHTASPSARILASFPPSTSTPPTSFAAIWADRTRGPETECWLFSTYETLPRSPSPTPSQQDEAKAQCLALLAGIARLPATTPLTVIGSLNESLLRLIGGEEVDNLVPQNVVSRDIKHDDGTGRVGMISGISVPYCKWLIAPPSVGDGAGGKEEQGQEQDKSLPPGYAFSKLRSDELRLTISRTEIPKTVNTLARLGSLGVRYTPVPGSTLAPEVDDGDAGQGALIAWAFLGVDGSLTSLHVEPEHRGRGLAKAVSRRLFRCLADDALAMGFRPVEGVEAGQGQWGEVRDGVGGYGRGDGWAHSDVAEANLESAGVARGLGGKGGWRVRWVSVDLAAAVER